MAEFDIQFTILRDGEEIGFGASMGSTIDAALYGVESIIQRREWETNPGMPDPEDTHVFPPEAGES